MATLAIKGHATRGSEVIQLLEMLGGKNKYNLWGNAVYSYYVIEHGEIIGGEYISSNEPYTFFTLEEFEEKFPYKVGDCVSSKYCKNYKIEKEVWDSRYNKVIYKLQGMGWYNVEELQPYKEETMETITIDDFKANTKEWLIDKLHGMIISNAIKTIGNIHDELHKPRYPKTYMECCEVLFPHSIALGKVLTSGYNCEKLKKFGELLVCHDAYRKIAGEQMGLDKPWEPTNETVYCISRSDNVIKSSYRGGKSNILEFPTEKMRDTFYENFKGLIEQCKELL